MSNLLNGIRTTTIKQIEELEKVVNKFKSGEQWLKVLIIVPHFSFKKGIWDVNQCPRLYKCSVVCRSVQ